MEMSATTRTSSPTWAMEYVTLDFGDGQAQILPDRRQILGKIRPAMKNIAERRMTGQSA